MNSLIDKHYDIYKLLTIIFIFYVVGDYITTIIAIDVSPLGINGETNPIAVMLYTNYGSTSLFMLKLLGFTILTAISLLLINKNQQTKHIIRRALFGFSIFSIVIVSINVYSILTA